MDASGVSPSRSELSLGFHEAHRRVGAATTRLQETSAQVEAIAELLVSRGVLDPDELQSRREQAENRLAATFGEAGLGVQLASEPVDKYAAVRPTVEIDCQARMPLCRAACCRLRFALTEQDIHEGVVEWDLTTPYVNRVAEDGWCVHCDPESRRCDVYAQRPGVCRTYDCRNDKRIWLDFDNRVVNPDLFP